MRLAAHDDVASTIMHTKEMLRGIPNKGMGFGALRAIRRLTALPRFMFNYLGQFGREEQADWLVGGERGQQVATDNHDNTLLVSTVVYMPINCNSVLLRGCLRISRKPLCKDLNKRCKMLCNRPSANPPLGVCAHPAILAYQR